MASASAINETKKVSGLGVGGCNEDQVDNSNYASDAFEQYVWRDLKRTAIH